MVQFLLTRSYPGTLPKSSGLQSVIKSIAEIQTRIEQHDIRCWSCVVAIIQEVINVKDIRTTNLLSFPVRLSMFTGDLSPSFDAPYLQALPSLREYYGRNRLNQRASPGWWFLDLPDGSKRRWQFRNIIWCHRWVKYRSRRSACCG